MKDSLAAGTMCSYFSMRITDAPNAPGGAPVYVPSCADPYLLDTIVRQYWERPDATHLSDCGAVINMVRPRPQGNGFVSLNNFSGAAAVAINAGMDQNSNTISPSHLWEALASGLTTPATVYGAAARVLAQRFRLGHFSSLESTPAELLALGAEDIGTAEARAAADEGVRQGATLLRNVGGRLPLRRGSRVAVVGPTALSATAALGDLYGPSSAICADDSNACWPLVGPAIAHANAGGATTVVAGVSMLKNDSSWGDALASIDGADTVVLTLGTDRSVVVGRAAYRGCGKARKAHPKKSALWHRGWAARAWAPCCVAACPSVTLCPTFHPTTHRSHFSPPLTGPLLARAATAVTSASQVCKRNLHSRCSRVLLLRRRPCPSCSSSFIISQCHLTRSSRQASSPLLLSSTRGHQPRTPRLSQSCSLGPATGLAARRSRSTPAPTRAPSRLTTCACRRGLATRGGLTDFMTTLQGRRSCASVRGSRGSRRLRSHAAGAGLHLRVVLLQSTATSRTSRALTAMRS